MIIKIYFNQKPLYLCDKIETEIEPFLHQESTVFIDELDHHTIKLALFEIQQPTVERLVFMHKNLEELKEAFFKKFKIVYAGGGLVYDQKQTSCLLIYRRGHWDLPKGKLDTGETIETCALREVEEETGLTKPNLKGLLTKTWHTYPEGSHIVLKETHWFKMIASNADQLIPQTEEDISMIKWVKIKELPKYFNQSFGSIVDVLKMA